MSAARIVRPENSTSSTSTTTLPSTPPAGMSVCSSALAGRSRRSSRYIVDVERASGNLGALGLGDVCRQPLRQWHAAFRDAEYDQVVGTLVTLDDLVRDPGQDAGDVAFVEDVPSQNREPGDPDRDQACSCLADLLPRLTGRDLKDVDRRAAYQARLRQRRNDHVHHACLSITRPATLVTYGYA